MVLYGELCSLSLSVAYLMLIIADLIALLKMGKLSVPQKVLSRVSNHTRRRRLLLL